MEMELGPFRCGAIQPRIAKSMFAARNCSPKPYGINKLTPEPAPTLSQLLAFYLEAGVDCALSGEPVDRLSDSGRPEPLKAVTSAGETIPARTLRPAPAPVAPASDPL